MAAGTTDQFPALVGRTTAAAQGRGPASPAKPRPISRLKISGLFRLQHGPPLPAWEAGHQVSHLQEGAVCCPASSLAGVASGVQGREDTSRGMERGRARESALNLQLSLEKEHFRAPAWELDTSGAQTWAPSVCVGQGGTRRPRTSLAHGEETTG